LAWSADERQQLPQPTILVGGPRQIASLAQVAGGTEDIQILVIHTPTGRVFIP